MSPTLPPLKRAAVALVLLNALTVAVVVVCFESARHFQERSEEAVVSLANDMTQVSQAEGAAERMVAIGRAYLLANEPELLLRAQAADAKLGRTVQHDRGQHRRRRRRSLEPLLASANRYRDVFSELLSGKTPPRDPRAISESLRKHLIPAREDLIARLESLATKKLEELDAVRAQARRGHARSLALMLVRWNPGRGRERRSGGSRRQRRPSQSCGRGRTAAIGPSHRSDTGPDEARRPDGNGHRRRLGDLVRGSRDARRSNSARAVLRGPVRRRFRRAVCGGARFRSPPGGDVFLLHAQRRRLRMSLLRARTGPFGATRRTVIAAWNCLRLPQAERRYVLAHQRSRRRMAGRHR